MRTTRTRAPGRAQGALTIVLLFALLGALLLAGTAPAAGHEGLGKGAKPGKPTVKAPRGTITSTTPTFTWGKARGATRYELRVYENGSLLLKKTGLRMRSWRSRTALPTDVNLSWKVRGRGAGGLVGPWSRSLKFKVVPLSPEKAITAFSFEGLAPPVDGAINATSHTIAATVPFGTNVTALIASFTTNGVSVAVAGTPQISGVTPNNFTNPVTYTVAAQDGTTQDYVVTVNVSPGSAKKAITAFSFEGLAPPVDGTINATSHTIAATVPFGTNVTALIASFTTNGVSVAVAGTPQISGVTPNNFTNPVTYTVAAQDGTTQDYVVTVNVSPGSAKKAITAFSFEGLAPPVDGTINATSHTIAATVPFGTNVTALIASFTTNGVSVAVAGTPQISGVTPNNFTNPVTYTVAAQDGTTQDYVVTVTVADPVIGQWYGGGKIAYIDGTGQHGLIAAAGDQSAGIQWYNGIYVQTYATATALGTGSANTDKIIATQLGSSSSYAAGLARAYRGGGYSDWYLPSKDELNALWLNKSAIGGFPAGKFRYWSSSEQSTYPTTDAWIQDLSDGGQVWFNKSEPYRVRAVRSF